MAQPEKLDDTVKTFLRPFVSALSPPNAGRDVPTPKIPANEQRVTDTLRNIYAVRHRLTRIRADMSRSKEEVALDVHSLCTELNRLENIFSRLRAEELRLYEESLGLRALNLDPLLTQGPGLKGLRSMADSIDDVEINRALLHASYDGRVGLLSHEALDGEDVLNIAGPEDTPTNAKGRWGSLLGVFRDWNFRTSVAEADDILKTNLNEHVNKDMRTIQKDITTLRAAIYSLRQRKQLSGADQILLRECSQRLRELTKKSIDMAAGGGSAPPTPRGNGSLTPRTGSSSPRGESPNHRYRE